MLVEARKLSKKSLPRLTSLLKNFAVLRVITMNAPSSQENLRKGKRTLYVHLLANQYLPVLVDDQRNWNRKTRGQSAGKYQRDDVSQRFSGTVPFLGHSSATDVYKTPRAKRPSPIKDLSATSKPLFRCLIFAIPLLLRVLGIQLKNSSIRKARSDSRDILCAGTEFPHWFSIFQWNRSTIFYTRSVNMEFSCQVNNSSYVIFSTKIAGISIHGEQQMKIFKHRSVSVVSSRIDNISCAGIIFSRDLITKRELRCPIVTNDPYKIANILPTFHLRHELQHRPILCGQQTYKLQHVHCNIPFLPRFCPPVVQN